MQREIEMAGISTVTLATIPEFTASVGVPRLVGIEYPQGRSFGQPHDVRGQTAILRATLEAVEKLEEPGGRIDLDLEWPEHRSKVHTHDDPPPIVGLIKRKPWLFKRFMDGDIPD